MTVTKTHRVGLRIAAALIVVPLLSACGSTNATSTPSANASPSASPTAEPTPYVIPSYSLAPAPVDCPTKTPGMLGANETYTVTMKTPFGDIVIKVESNLGPHAAAAFLALSRCGYYNNVIFHRPVPGFVIQGGDGQYGRLPLTTENIAKVGQGTPGWNVVDDKVTQKYTRGTVAMARGSQADSGGSQFFIVLDDKANETLGASTANNYAIFGHVTSGMDIVDKIAAVPSALMDPQDQNTSTALYPVPILGTTVTP